MTWTAERRARLRLARTQSVGPLTYARLIEEYGSAAEALDALPSRAKAAGRSDFNLWTEDAAQREIDKTEAFGAQIILSGEEGFPELLAALGPPPPLVITKGNPEICRKPTVAMVGARNASAAAIRLANDIARNLGEAGWVVVSGLARGVDAAAHSGALATGTIGVIAGGIDNIYPPQNEDLYRDIAAQGLILTESSIGYEPRARDFPKRNRLITGLALGVVVVEAAQKSGSLISARTALEQGREVMAIPGSPLDPRSRGSNGLIRSGAALVENADDIIEILRPMGPIQTDLFRETFTDFHSDEAENIPDEAIQRLVSLVSPVPVSVPDLAKAANLPLRNCASLLVELELSGQIQSLPGGLVRRRL